MRLPAHRSARPVDNMATGRATSLQPEGAHSAHGRGGAVAHVASATPRWPWQPSQVTYPRRHFESIMGAAPASAQIDRLIADLDDWRGLRIAQIRRLMREADAEIIEEWKWM